jgi:hypothetical protein
LYGAAFLLCVVCVHEGEGVGRKRVRRERSVCVSGGDGRCEGEKGVKERKGSKRKRKRERIVHTGTNRTI